MSVESFFGRTHELDLLNGWLKQATASGSGRLIGMRGRRQVGKSRLAQHFAAGSAVPYGMVAGLQGTPVGIQMRRAVETLRSSTRPLTGLDAFTTVVPKDWYDLLARMGHALRGGPAILVIDEFPWAVQACGGLDGLLQSLWDSDLSKLPVLVILIGSDEAMMDRLFEHDRALFGRLDDQLVVQPFNPAETALALGGDRSPLDVFDAQLVTGGFPELIAHASRFSDVAALVEDAVSRPHTLLADVAQINLAGELTGSSSARLVLEAIGADEVGVVNFSGITRALGGGKATETAVIRATEILAREKRILAIDTPAGQRGGRLKRYRIADSYLRFWFRFVQPHLRDIEVGRSDLAVNAFRRSWPAWRGHAVEPLIREAILRLAPGLEPPFDEIEAVDAWWERTGTHEWDIVGSRRDNAVVAVGSVKWRERKQFDNRDLAALTSSRSVIPRAEGARLLAVSASGVASGTHVDLTLNAADLLGGWRA
jgi:uncharacterized protein